LLRALLRELDPDTIVAYIFNPVLSDLELLQSIKQRVWLAGCLREQEELIDELNAFSSPRSWPGRGVVIVDEAQNLAPWSSSSCGCSRTRDGDGEAAADRAGRQPELRAFSDAPISPS